MTSEYILSELDKAKGLDKKYLIYALGSIADAAAEKYYSGLLGKPGKNLHYLCQCRCKCVSDYAADELEKVTDKLITLNTQTLPQDMNNMLWSVLNLCAFKNSKHFLIVLKKIGKYHDRLKQYELDIHYLIHSQGIKPFLSKRASKWFAYCCEKNFIYALNDLLMCSITRLGEDFLQEMISLGADYPDCYGRVAFFADFVQDNHIAYDKFAGPENYDVILASLNGVNYSRTKEYYLYSPYWFMDNSNKLYHSRIRLGKFDIRWIEYLCKLSQNIDAVCSYYPTAYGLAVSSYRHMSEMMLSIFDSSDEKQKMLLRKYFENTTALYANEADIEGLEICGEFDRYELIVNALKNILSGRSNKNILQHILNGMKISKNEKLMLADRIENYICEHYTDNKNVMEALLLLTRQCNKNTRLK